MSWFFYVANAGAVIVLRRREPDAPRPFKVPFYPFIPVVFIGAIVLGILIYYWTVFSGRIDNLLAGEVYTRTAGIYAAPK